MSVEVGSEWLERGGTVMFRVISVDGGRVTHDYRRHGQEWKRSLFMPAIGTWLRHCSPALSMDSAMDLAGIVAGTNDPDHCGLCNKRWAECTCKRIDEPEVPKKAAKVHDFSDRYCVRVNNKRGIRLPLCKDCGVAQRDVESMTCVPMDWRADADRLDAALAASRERRNPPSRPTYAAPELRAANAWACGLVRGTR